MTPRRLSCLSRCVSRVRDRPGAPSRISPKVSQPRYRLRMISGVHRSAKISEPRAMGQYWPYVLTTSVSRSSRPEGSPDSLLQSPDCCLRWVFHRCWAGRVDEEEQCEHRLANEAAARGTRTPSFRSSRTALRRTRGEQDGRTAVDAKTARSARGA